MKDGRQDGTVTNQLTKLAEMLKSHFRERRIRPSEFAKRWDFDQGLLSKIINLNVRTLGLESYLKLARGLKVHPDVLFRATGREDLERLVREAYGEERAEGERAA